MATQFLCHSQESAFYFGKPRQVFSHPQPKPPHRQVGRERKGRGASENYGLAHFSLPSVFKLGKDLVVLLLNFSFYCLNNTKLTTTQLCKLTKPSYGTRKKPSSLALVKYFAILILFLLCKILLESNPSN